MNIEEFANCRKAQPINQSKPNSAALKPSLETTGMNVRVFKLSLMETRATKRRPDDAQSFSVEGEESLKQNGIDLEGYGETDKQLCYQEDHCEFRCCKWIKAERRSAG